MFSAALGGRSEMTPSPVHGETAIISDLLQLQSPVAASGGPHRTNVSLL